LTIISLVMQRFIARPFVARASFRPASTLVSKVDSAVKELPFRDAVRYTDKNVKWTAQEFNAHIDNHADAMLDHGFGPGMSVINWMPDSKVKHVTLMAAAKLGMQITDMDSKINTVAEVRECLALAQCRMIVFDPQSEGVDRLELLRMSIPEFYHYDDTQGQWFHSKYYPNLKFFLHSGFDIELGCQSFKTWMINNPSKPELDKTKAGLSDDAPLVRTVKRGASGLEVSEFSSHKDVYTKKMWGFADKLITKEYFEL
jgi:hypothetical protein